MLLGQFGSRVDKKGRVALPKKLREKLGKKLVVTQGYERSLIVVALVRWEELIRGTGNKPFIVGSARDTNRFLLGGASVIELDGQGRFVVPVYLRKYSRIDSEVVFLGLGRYVEMWAVKRWKNYQEYLDKNITKITQKLSELN